MSDYLHDVARSYRQLMTRPGLLMLVVFYAVEFGFDMAGHATAVHGIRDAGLSTLLFAVVWGLVNPWAQRILRQRRER